MGLSKGETKELALATYDSLDSKPPKRLVAKAFNLTRQGLYYESKIHYKDNLLLQGIEYWHQIDDTLGCRKLSKLLKVSKIRVFRVMLKYDIKPRRITPQYNYHGKGKDIAGNLLLNKDNLEYYSILVSDIFQFRLIGGRWIYCCFIIRKETRQVLSFSYGTSMEADLVGVATKDLKRVDLVTDLTKTPIIFHSDQGSQYGASTTIDILNELNFERSMSRAGTPTDNAISERFVRTFKDSVVKRYRYSNLEEFKEFSTKWLNFYNNQRPHYSLKDVAPNEYARNLGLSEIEYLCLKLV